MKNAVIYSLVATTAAAFAPTQQAASRSSTALNEFCRGYVGGESVEPMFVGDTGSKNFDPLKISEVRGWVRCECSGGGAAPLFCGTKGDLGLLECSLSRSRERGTNGLSLADLSRWRRLTAPSVSDADF